MLKFIFKNSIRIIYISFLLIISVIVLYIFIGHRYYSILEKYQYMIVDNIQKQYNVKVSYSNSDEKWKNLLPNLVFYDLKIEDENHNIYKFDRFNIKFDLIEIIKERQLNISDLDITTARIIYNEKVSVEGSNFDISTLKRIRTEKINIEHVNIEYNTLKGKKYIIEDVSLKYIKPDDFITLNYNNLKIIQTFSYDNEIKSKTVISGNINSYLKVIKDLGFQTYIDDAEYNKVYNIEGDIKAEITYLKDITNKEIWNIDIFLDNNKVKLLSENIIFENFKGIINFNSDLNLTSNAMSCTYNNKACSFNIKNVKNGLDFNFEAIANKNIIDKYTSFLNIETITGESKLVGVYHSIKNGNDILNIKSNLKGILVKGVPLFNKSLDEEKILNINYIDEPKNPRIEVYYGQNTIFTVLNKSLDTQILLNKTEKYTAKSGLYVSGIVNDITTEDVLSFIDSLNFKSSNEQNILNYNLDIQAINSSYLGITLEKAYITNIGELLNVVIDDSKILGKVNYNIKNKDIKLDLENFNYKSSLNVKSYNSMVINQYPNIEANIKKLSINDYKGHISFKGHNKGSYYLVDNIDGVINNIKPTFIIKAEGVDNNITTQLFSIDNNKLIEFENIGDILADYGYIDTLTSKSGVVYGKLSWDGFIPTFKSLSGELRLELKDGKLNMAETSTRVLKIFRVFEFKTLSQILKMNFEVLKKGTYYSILEGKGTFSNGIFDINNDFPITLKSNNYIAILKGNIDFMKEQYNNTLNINLPVTQKLPALALLSGNPAIIGAVWLTDQLLGDKINALYSLKFKITGKFEDPKITL